MSALILSLFALSSCEETLTNDSQSATPIGVEVERVSATINQNNLAIIAKSMMQTLNQINPAVSNDIYTVSQAENAQLMSNCAYSGIQYAEVEKIDERTYDYALEFLDCQDSAEQDRLLGELNADVIFSEAGMQAYSIDVSSQIKQTNRFGEMTISQVNSLIDVNDQTSKQSFHSKILLDSHGTFFVKSVSLLEQDNQTQQWISGHLILTSIQEEIDVYIQKEEGLYFEFSDGVTQVISWDELNAI